MRAKGLDDERTNFPKAGQKDRRDGGVANRNGTATAAQVCHHRRASYDGLGFAARTALYLFNQSALALGWEGYIVLGTARLAAQIARRNSR